MIQYVGLLESNTGMNVANIRSLKGMHSNKSKDRVRNKVICIKIKTSPIKDTLKEG